MVYICTWDTSARPSAETHSGQGQRHELMAAHSPSCAHIVAATNAYLSPHLGKLWHKLEHRPWLRLWYRVLPYNGP